MSTSADANKSVLARNQVPCAGVGPSKRLSFKTSRREETRLDCQAGFLEVKSVVVTTL